MNDQQNQQLETLKKHIAIVTQLNREAAKKREARNQLIRRSYRP